MSLRQGPGHNYLIPPELSELRCGEPSHAGGGGRKEEVSSGLVMVLSCALWTGGQAQGNVATQQPNWFVEMSNKSPL